MDYKTELIKKRIFVTGSGGVLGSRAANYFLRQKNYELLCTSGSKNDDLSNLNIKICDVTDKEKLKKLIIDFYPDIIINAAAFTNVDLNETEKEIAWKINVKAVEGLAEICRTIDVHLIHISSDYIFDGKNGPYSEVDRANPLSYYGRTKLASENALKISGINYTILRTNVLYGGYENGKSDFVSWVINSLKSDKKINIVTDQFNNPTFVDDLVNAISKIINFKKKGIYNIGGREYLSRFDFTQKIADYFNLNKKLINPILTKELNQKAIRPLMSGLVTLKAESQIGFKPHTITESFEKIRTKLKYD